MVSGVVLLRRWIGFGPCKETRMVQSRRLGDEWFGLGCCGCFPKYSLVRSSWLLSVRRARELRRYSSFASWFTFTFRSINANRVRCGARCSRLLMTFLSFTLVRANVWSLYGYTLCILLNTSFWLVPSVVERCNFLPSFG